MEVYWWGVSLSPHVPFPYLFTWAIGKHPCISRFEWWMVIEGHYLAPRWTPDPFCWQGRPTGGVKHTIKEAHVWMTGAGLHLAELDAFTMAADQRGFNIIWYNQPLSLNSGGPPPLMSLECFNPILSAYIFYTHNFRYLKTRLGQGKVGPYMTPARVL